MISHERLLEGYKAYDYLNSDAEHPAVKIFVSYIKPSFLFKSKILTPIHLGRAVEAADSKDGVASKDDLLWLHRNCIGDDDVEGSISSLNRRVGFFTGTYWAWKNYERLGSPDYFGSFGYRKLLVPSCLSRLPDYDAILPRRQHLVVPLNVQFKGVHGEIALKMLKDVVGNCFSKSEKESFEEYFRQSDGYFHELYILRKELFFEFSEWMYRKLAFLRELYPVKVPTEPSGFCGPLDENVVNGLKNFLGEDELMHCERAARNKIRTDKRDLAFLLERLTGFFLYDRIVRPRFRYLEAEFIDYTLTQESGSPFRLAIINKIRETARKAK